MNSRTARPTLLVAVFLALATTPGVNAQEPIRFARHPDISPDGKLVAFSYLGDVWVVESIGGVARPVTLHEAHDGYPAFSPDGRSLAFASNRYGSYDVFVVPVVGGKPRRLTSDSATDIPTGWTPDGKSVLFVSNREPTYPAGQAFYAVPAEGGAAKPVGPRDGKDGTFSPKSDWIAYVRGQGSWYRKGYRGSSNDDVWLAKADGTGHRRVTDFSGQDGYPMWSPDGQTLYYVSERFGHVANVCAQDHPDADPKKRPQPRQLTFHSEDGVRRARISGNGEWIVYECGADLYVVSTKGGSPRRLAIEVHADDKSNVERTVTFTRGATEYALAPDEKHVAFVVHGELFLAPVPSGGKATRLTDSPAYDHGIAWAPDGKKLVFASDRSGHENLYLLESDDPDSSELVKARKFKVKQLTTSTGHESGALFSPDGKRITFLRAGQLWGMNADGSGQRPIVAQVQVFDYDWSPDGQWIVYARSDGSFASELYVIPAAGGPARNVTRYATYNGDVTWSADGKKLSFISQRVGPQGLFVMSLQKPAAPGNENSRGIDFDDIHLRVNRPAETLPAEDGTISPDGSRVAFRSTGPGGEDLWVASTDGREQVRLTTGNAMPHGIRWSKRVSSLVYFLDNTGSLRAVRTGAPAGLAEAVRVPFSAKMTVKRDEEFREMFEQSWRVLSENFYDSKFHGADWKAVRAKYQPLVAHVAQREDLYALVSLMLGELNASHLGISGPATTDGEETGDLGLVFDPKYEGPGLKIAEILKRGPADRRGISLKPGEVILSIDRQSIKPETEVSRLLNGKVGETVSLEVTAEENVESDDAKARRRVDLQPVSRSQVAELMYERWVEHNAREVASLSEGKLGYVHIPEMNEKGLERFVRTLYSECFDKEAIVIDVRYNGGGFTHDQVLNYLGGREHTVFRQRNGGEGLVMRNFDRKWTKPMVVLVNNRSFSDAEIFPAAFRTLGLGKVVGQATGGQVIGTSTVRLIDGSAFRVPRTGVFTSQGVNMEREGVLPDVVVEPTPEQTAKGIDVQLEKAVDVLQQDVVAWKKARTPQPRTDTAAPTGGNAGAPSGN